ncbi:hypothetical protein ES703_98696 [subsurface metagenome]
MKVVDYNIWSETDTTVISITRWCSLGNGVALNQDVGTITVSEANTNILSADDVVVGNVNTGTSINIDAGAKGVVR